MKCNQSETNSKQVQLSEREDSICQRLSRRTSSFSYCSRTILLVSILRLCSNSNRQYPSKLAHVVNYLEYETPHPTARVHLPPPLHLPSPPRGPQTTDGTAYATQNTNRSCNNYSNMSFLCYVLVFIFFFSILHVTKYRKTRHGAALVIQNIHWSYKVLMR